MVLAMEVFLTLASTQEVCVVGGADGDEKINTALILDLRRNPETRTHCA